MSMQRIENDITPLRVLSHIIHGGGIDRAPAVDESNPVGLDAPLIAPCGEVRNQAGAPIDHRAENVEHERLDLRKIGHKASPFTVFIPAAAAGGNQRAQTRTSEFLALHEVCDI